MEDKKKFLNNQKEKDKQNILSQGLSSIEPTKNLLNENQLSQKLSYAEQFQNKVDFSNILNGIVDINISFISEQTLQKRVRSQIVKRRNVHQTRIFQKFLCQIINQNKDQHAIISYHVQDNNNSIQHISSKKFRDQVKQKQNQKAFCDGNICQQNSIGNQEGQIQLKQINKEAITNNQVNYQQLLKLQKNSFINKQQLEKEQTLKYEQITDQVNIDQQENIHRDQNCSQNSSNKKEGYIQEQQNIQEMNSNYQVNFLLLIHENTCTIQQNHQQQGISKQPLNQEQTNDQENVQQLEITDRKEYMYDRICSNNDLSKIEVQIEEKNTTKQTISNNQINSPQIIEFKFEEKTKENLLKDEQQHNKETFLNYEETTDQINANDQDNICENINLIKENDKQIHDEKKTMQSQYQSELKSSLKKKNPIDNPIKQNTITIQREIQSIEYEKQSKPNNNIEECDNLTKCYSSQLEKMFKVIMDYKFSEFEESGELQQTGCEIKKQWNQQIFEKVEGNQVQSEIFQSQKSKIFESLQQKQYYLCKILISNQIQDFILGYFQDKYDNFDEYIFQITYVYAQSNINQQKLILTTLGFEYEYVKLQQENISILILKKDQFLSISDKFEQLVQFKQNIQQIQNYCEINSSNSQECKSCGNKEICEDQACFKNIKSRILAFLQDKEYLYCEYSNNKINGILFQLNQEEIIPQYLNYVYKIIFNFQENIQINSQNTCQQQPIYFCENISQKKQNFTQEENVKQISNFDLMNEYSFKDYQVLKKSDQNTVNSNLNPNYQRKWDFEVFNILNKNKVSEAFLKLQNEIIQILKSKNYFLCNCFISNQYEDIFVGYYEEAKQKYIDYIFVILYNPKDQEISKYKLVKQFNEVLNHFTINCFTHVLILSKDAFIQIYNKYEQVSNIKIEWSKDYFEIINKDKLINLQKFGDCENCKNKCICDEYLHFRNFQQSKNLIFNKLIEKNYYMCEYLNKGGEGLIFQGYRLSIKEKQDVVFKILFDSNQEQIKNEIQIMKMFDCHINIIKFIDYIEIKDNIHALVLEKCKFSLKEELEYFLKNKQFPLNKLLQMIFSLLDGLVQFRIYNILHLDIKPQNILLTNSDQYVYTDFGMSSLKKNNQQSDIKGFTLFYASPEQKQYDKNIDYLSDVYSLGITFEIILKFFQNVQQQKYQKITDNLMKMVKEKMIENELKSRFNCLELRSEFFKFILQQNESIEFLNYYIKQIKQILNSYPYDKNKEISYFFQISLSYRLNLLDYWQQFVQQNIQSDTQQIQQNIAQSLDDVGNCYKSFGNNKKALEYQLKSLQMRKQLFKDNHTDIALSLNNVGNCYYNLGDNKKALLYQLESLQMTKQLFKDNHSAISLSLQSIGCCYQKLGNINKALEYQLESLQMRKQIFKKNNPDIALSLNSVGSCYQSLGDSKKALEYLLESLQMTKQIFKENHPDLAQSLHNVGCCYAYLGDYKKSLEYLLESLQMRKQIFKNSHPDIAFSLNNVENHSDIATSLNSVGSCYAYLGYYQKALEYLLESLQMRKQIFKENHPDIAETLNNVGCYYVLIGDYKKALEYLLESLQMRKQIFKENHPVIAETLNNVGNCQAQLGDNKRSLENLLKSLKMRKQILKENHPDIALSLFAFGQYYYKFGDNKKALEYYFITLQIYKQIFKNNHPDIARSLNNVGLCYYNLNDNKIALEYNFESLQMKKQISKENHPDIAQSLNNIALCYYNLKDNKKALEYNLESLQMRKQIFKENHPDIASSLNNVGLCYYNLKDNKKALEYYLKYYQMRKQISKQNDPSIVSSLNNVGKCYQNLGDNKKALEYYLESLQMTKQIYKENHPEIAYSLNKVGVCQYNLSDYKKGLEYLLESLQMTKEISKEIFNYNFYLLIYISQCFLFLGDIEIFYEYHLEFIQIANHSLEIFQFFFNGNYQGYQQ